VVTRGILPWKSQKRCDLNGTARTVRLIEECMVETSPDFDESITKTEPPAKKARRRKVATKKERERLGKEVRALRLSEVATFCLDKTRYKLTEHANPSVKEFSLAFEPEEIFFIVRCLKNLFEYSACAQKKDKFITFQFQWHQKCGLLLVKSTAELVQLCLDPADTTANAVLTARQ